MDYDLNLATDVQQTEYREKDGVTSKGYQKYTGAFFLMLWEVFVCVCVLVCVWGGLC